jgi:release factor glutamine methyltransferase
VTYRPPFPADHLERLRRWHETAYRLSREEGVGGQTFEYLGRILEVPDQVHPITGMSHLLGEAVLAEVRAGDRVLDVGTGCGVNAILAAPAASRVLAVDINPQALAATRANAARNGVADRVEARHSDVFGAVEGEYDLIVFDPPYRWFKPRDLPEAASTDEGYRALTAFVRGARRHLAPGGRMLVAFGSSGDLGYLRRLLDEEGFAVRVVATQSLVRDGWRVDYFTFRVAPEGRDEEDL